MGAPPSARVGVAARNAGRSVAAGLGPYERLLDSRASSFELWSPLRTLLVEEVGLVRLQRLWGQAFGLSAWRRFAAFVSQAEAFYTSAEDMPPESRPLVAYYFSLNITKAFLTCVEPSMTGARLMHGIADGFEQKSRYWFTQERARITDRGVFRELATRTGTGYCYPKNELVSIQRLAPYLAETVDIYEDAVLEPPRLVPLSSIEVWSDQSDVWLRVEADRSELRRRGLGPASLPDKAKLFGKAFRLVQSDNPTASYESIKTWRYGGKRVLNALPGFTGLFEQSLIHTNRGTTPVRHLVVISARDRLLSQEAVTFLVLHHLCNMVRYRPEQVVKLNATKWAFLLTDWIPRALENYLLTMTSRILQEEVRIG